MHVILADILGIRYNESKGNWLKKRTEKWEREIRAVRETVEKYHQESYSVAALAIQSEWIFLQRVTKDTGQAFAGLETFLRETFLPRLFFERSIPPPVVGSLSTLPVKKAGTSLQNRVTSSKEKYNSLYYVQAAS